MSILVHSILNAYPMDSMVSEIDADGLPVYDRPYNADDLRDVISRMVTDGIYPDYLDEMAPSLKGGAWYIGCGGAIADGLYIPSAEELKVIDQTDIATGQYAYLCVAGRYDINARDGAIYARISENPSEQPVRTDSIYELILARVDWRGSLTDLRASSSMCGIVSAVNKIDADSFMTELKLAVQRFDLEVGNISTLPPGTTPEVTIRKPEMLDGITYIDFAIPRGPKGDPGKDADRPPTVYVQPADKVPPEEPGNVWFIDSEGEGVHTISDMKVYERRGLFPDNAVYPGDNLYPGGIGRWASHKFSPSMIATE